MTQYEIKCLARCLDNSYSHNYALYAIYSYIKRKILLCTTFVSTLADQSREIPPHLVRSSRDPRNFPFVVTSREILLEWGVSLCCTFDISRENLVRFREKMHFMW